MSKKEPKNLDDWAGLREELLQESERSAVIVGAAFVDALLRSTLECFFVDHPKEVRKLLNEMNGALGTFAARARTAYCLGLVTGDELHDLKRIGLIRNRFAHRIHGFSFDDKEVTKWCNQLKWVESDTDSLREKYVFSVITMIANIQARRYQRKHRCALLETPISDHSLVPIEESN